MQIIQWGPAPIHQVRYRYAQTRGGTGVGVLAITRAMVAGLPAPLDALVLTADLQGRELIPSRKPVTAPHRLVGREGPRLLGEIAAEDLLQLAAKGILPPPDRTGVVLAGDFWTEPGSKKRGSRAGDVGPVWKAFRDRFRWVAGVLGNHDRFDGSCAETKQAGMESGVYLLNGDVATIDGLRIGGVGGIIGNSSRTQRKPEEQFLQLLAKVMHDQPDVVVLHEGPDGPESGGRGSESIRLALVSHPPTMVVCGHSYWHVPLQRLANGTPVWNVDSRVVVLTRQKEACDQQSSAEGNAE